VGYYLAKTGLRFVILDASQRVGDSWRNRWDSLRLFTPAKFDSLDGMPFPAPRNAFPTKDEMADYLEAYAARFKLPVRSGVQVEALRKHGARYLIKAGTLEMEADQVWSLRCQATSARVCRASPVRFRLTSCRCIRLTIATSASSSPDAC
jgi:putative flavoprotein involved in K+ transport